MSFVAAHMPACSRLLRSSIPPRAHARTSLYRLWISSAFVVVVRAPGRRLRAEDEEAYDLAGDRQTARRCRVGDDQFSRSLVWKVAADPYAAVSGSRSFPAPLRSARTGKEKKREKDAWPGSGRRPKTSGVGESGRESEGRPNHEYADVPTSSPGMIRGRD
jgi:hypothetical protein